MKKGITGNLGRGSVRAEYLKKMSDILNLEKSREEAEGDHESNRAQACEWRTSDSTRDRRQSRLS